MKKIKGKLVFRKTRRYIKFANGIEVQLPEGWEFEDEFEIRGIKQTKTPKNYE
jgi:hypothetical protein